MKGLMDEGRDLSPWSSLISLKSFFNNEAQVAIHLTDSLQQSEETEAQQKRETKTC